MRYKAQTEDIWHIYGRASSQRWCIRKVAKTAAMSRRTKSLSFLVAAIVVLAVADARYLTKVKSSSSSQQLLKEQKQVKTVLVSSKRSAELNSKSAGQPFSLKEYLKAKKFEPKPEAYQKGKDPIELAGKHEGDIDLPRRTLNKNAVIGADARWPNARIPYQISTDFSEAERSTIASAVSRIQEVSCIRISPATDADADYIFILKSVGCSCVPGRAHGIQYVSLGDGCLTDGPGVAMHELMHAIGFFHEQSRTDRDNYVRINWQNINPGQESNFDKYPSDTLGLPYDYGSIMHYKSTDFSSNNLPTIEPLDSNVQIGQRTDYSAIDIKKMNILYKCDQAQNDVGSRDNDGHCQGWAAAGECTANPDYMLVECKKSCGVAKRDIEELDPAVNEIRDEDDSDNIRTGRALQSSEGSEMNVNTVKPKTTTKPLQEYIPDTRVGKLATGNMGGNGDRQPMKPGEMASGGNSMPMGGNEESMGTNGNAENSGRNNGTMGPMNAGEMPMAGNNNMMGGKPPQWPGNTNHGNMGPMKREVTTTVQPIEDGIVDSNDSTRNGEVTTQPFEDFSNTIAFNDGMNEPETTAAPGLQSTESDVDGHLY